MRLNPLSRAIFSISAQAIAMPHKLTKPLSIGVMTLGSLISYQSVMAAEVVSVTTTTPVTEEVKIEAIEVNASADASKSGLPAAYQGGQVATGSRVGILGNKSIMQTPFSTTAYTNEYVKDKQASTVGDVLKNDSSVRVARGYGNFQESYVMRGFVTDSDETMFNGLYGVLPRQSIAAPLFERVEVLRGASAFLNGAAPGGGNAGGTISLLPKRAGNSPLNEVTLGYGAGSRGTGSVDLSRRFGTNQAFGARLNATYTDGDTAIDHEKAKLGLASLGLDYRNSNTRLSADIGYQDNKLKNTRTNVGILSTTVPKAPNADKNWAQPWSYSNEKDVFGTLRGEYDINNNVTAYAAYGARSSKEANSLANMYVDKTNGDGHTYRFDNTRKDEISTGELGLKGKFTTGTIHHDWVISGNKYQLTKKNAYEFDPLNPLATNLYNPTSFAEPAFSAKAYKGGVLSDPKRTNKTDLSSVAIGDTLGLLDNKLQVMLGVRHQSIETTDYNYNTQVQQGHYEKSKTTPAVGINYRINPTVSVYANYIESLKIGETASQQFNGHPVTNSGEQLAPYSSKQSEIGAKFDNGLIGAGLALFSTKQPRSFYDANNGYKFTSSGNNRNQGIELNVFGQPTSDLKVLGGITYLNAQQKDTGTAALDGNRSVGVPKIQSNLGLEWNVPSVEGLTLTGNLAQTGSVYLDNANTQKISGYTTANLGARYKTHMGTTPVTLRGEVANIANKNYWITGSSFGGYLVEGDPRTLKLSATFDF